VILLGLDGNLGRRTTSAPEPVIRPARHHRLSGMSLVPEPSPFRVADLRDGGLHPFPALDAGPGERADLGAELDRLGLGEVAGVCFLAFAWVRCGMLRRVSPFRDDDASARATDTAGEACRAADAAAGGVMSPAAGGDARLPRRQMRRACRAPLRVMGMTIYQRSFSCDGQSSLRSTPAVHRLGPIR
jgi:hypothetical protein